ncbi:MAG: hypothetical protein HY518_05595, partial [Candidatus Aenigmarchaeota archaeon]|nr:hypothetical protein [Candidatus Aenigmarchaeota archaeon]
MAGIDIIGDIAIVEMPEKGHDNRKVIESILKTHRHVKTICMKAGERSGKYRLRRLKVIHGKETVTIHREYGYQLKLDVRKAYFSPRESTERQRIAGQVKPGETVLVMFAGIGPFA